MKKILLYAMLVAVVLAPGQGRALCWGENGDSETKSFIGRAFACLPGFRKSNSRTPQDAEDTDASKPLQNLHADSSRKNPPESSAWWKSKSAWLGLGSGTAVLIITGALALHFYPELRTLILGSSTSGFTHMTNSFLYNSTTTTPSPDFETSTQIFLKDAFSQCQTLAEAQWTALKKHFVDTAWTLEKEQWEFDVWRFFKWGESLRRKEGFSFEEARQSVCSRLSEMRDMDHLWQGIKKFAGEIPTTKATTTTPYSSTTPSSAMPQSTTASFLQSTTSTILKSAFDWCTSLSWPEFLTWNFLGLCVSGPFYGPISDSFGRKKSLLVALSLFLAGGVVIIFAQPFNLLLGGRFLQGLGSGGCFILGAAITFDFFKKKEALRVVNWVNSVILITMAAAPLLGGYINYVYGFRAIFIAMTILAFLSLVICLLFLDEPLPKHKRTRFQGNIILAKFTQASTNLSFWQLTSVSGLLWAGYITFLSCTAILFVVELGLSKKALPLLQALFLCAYVAGSLTCNTAMAKWGEPLSKKIGLGCIMGGGISFAIISWVCPLNPYALTIAMLPYAFGVPWSQTPYYGELMGIFPSIKGVVASLMISARLLITVLIVALVNQFYNGRSFPSH